MAASINNMLADSSTGICSCSVGNMSQTGQTPLKRVKKYFPLKKV
jgi:hypothetical protein